MTTSKSQLLDHFIIRLPKDQAAFTYFQLEANEGLFFYSTISTSLEGPFRDIELFSPHALQIETRNFLDHLTNAIQYQILLQETISDCNEVINIYPKSGKKYIG